MKTLLIAGLAGIFALAPGPAIAAIDSDDESPAVPMVDLSFASSTALANPAAGAKSMSRMGNTRQMRHMGNMRHMKNRGGAHRMKHRGNMRHMRGNRHVGKFRLWLVALL